jgi:hypothetical protein
VTGLEAPLPASTYTENGRFRSGVRLRGGGTVIADVVAADRGDGGPSGDYELVVVADVVGGLGAHQGELVEVQPAKN